MGKLSVVTITRNNYEELVETVRSLNLLSEYHLIVVNGGECERTEHFLRERKIEHISGPDRGIADAFNKGIDIALKNSTDYIIFINSGDVVIDAFYAEKALRFLDKNRNYFFSYGDIMFRDSLVGKIYMPASRLNLGRGMFCGHPTMIYRKSAFEQIELFDTTYRIAMDYEHLCRMCKNGLNGHHIMSPPFVLMDGTGISVMREKAAIKECHRALLKNGFMKGNRWGFVIRLTFFVVREILRVLKFDGVLAKWKRAKYSSPVPHSRQQDNFVIVTNSYQRNVALVERSLRHSLRQEPSPQRVIFIDQNEKKLQLAEDISTHLLLEHRHVRKKGVSSARNTLTVSPDVEWIIFCDDDGHLMEGYTERFCEIVQYGPSVEVIAGGIVRDDNGNFYSPRHRVGGNLNKFLYSKLLMGSNFACKVKTFKKLGGFDERFGAGAYWGSSEETDFAWKSHFSGVPMLYCQDLKVHHVKPYALSFSSNLKKSFLYGKGKGALVAKWIFEERKFKPLYEMIEMAVVPFAQIFISIAKCSPKKIAIYATTLVARCWGFFLFGWQFVFSRESG